MQYIKHNDYEIINLIKEGNQDALALMFDKYKNLISKKICKFNLVYDYDDAYQEALMILYKSIVKFDDHQLKSFTRFFELNLDRRFITIVSKRVRRGEIFSQNELYIYENNHSVESNSVYYELYKKEIAKMGRGTTQRKFNSATLPGIGRKNVRKPGSAFKNSNASTKIGRTSNPTKDAIKAGGQQRYKI